MDPTSTVSRPVEIGLRLTGNWPGSRYSNLVRLLWATVMFVGQVFQYRYVFSHFSINDLSNLVDSISTTLPYSLLFCKLIIFWLNRRTLVNILTGMSRDWKECSTDSSKDAMTTKARLSHRCSNIIIGVYAMAVFLYTTAIIEFQSNDQFRDLLIKMEFPFDSQESPTYEFVMLVQFIQLLGVASAIGMLDALIITLMLHIGGQIEIMHQYLEGFCSEKEKDGTPLIEAKTLVGKHHRIITFSDNVESLFTHIALMQFLSNTLIICCIGFLIVSTFGTDERFTMLLKTLVFYTAIALEAFIFSFSGEYLSEKSKTVGDVAYQSLWYILRPAESRVLLLVILRSQKKLTITAGKFMELSLEGFTTIMKASVSYISVLYAML